MKYYYCENCGFETSEIGFEYPKDKKCPICNHDLEVEVK